MDFLKMIQRDSKIVKKELNKAKNLEKTDQNKQQPKKGILKNKKGWSLKAMYRGITL